MTYTFKLSRRLARLRDASLVVAAVFTMSCTGDEATGPESGPLTDPNGISVAPDPVLMTPNQAVQFIASTLESSALSASLRKGRGRGWRNVVGLRVAPETLTVAGGSAANFVAAGSLSDGSSVEPSVTWRATGGTIDANGKYTAGSIAGAYAVSATASNGIADTAAVIVTQSPPSVVAVSLSPASVTLPEGGSKRFVAMGKSNDGSTVAVGARYAATGGTISADGLYQAGQTPGTFRVVASDTVTNLADTAAVIIEPPPATLQAVVLSPANASLTVGGTQRFMASGKMSDGSTSSVLVNLSVTGGQITSDGLYTAGTTAGIFRVIATQQGGTLADTASVSISSPFPSSPVPSVTVTPNSGSVAEGKTIQLTAIATGTDGNALSGQSFTWASSNPSVATVNSLGVVTGVAEGSARITATSGQVQGHASINVTAASVSTTQGCPESGYLRLVKVSTVSSLTSALANASPGDQIQLAPGVYTINALNLNKSGTATNRIVLCGPRTAIITGGPYVGVSGSYWWLRGFRVTGIGKGIWQSAGNYNLYDSLEVDHTQTMGIHIGGAGTPPKTGNEIRYNRIHHTGLGTSPQWGEGIYIGAGNDINVSVSNTWIHHNTVENTTAEGIELKTGSNGQTVEFNTLTNTGSSNIVGGRGPIMIRSNNNRIFDNTVNIAPSVAIATGTGGGEGVGGNNNVYRRNTGSNLGASKVFQFDSGTTGNVVYCDNVAVDGVLGVSCTQ